MTKTDQVEFNITFSKTQITEEDYMARQLLSELRELDVESADLVTMGSIVISALPNVLPAVVALVQAWSSRGQGRTIKFKGKGFEFEGSPEELQKLLELLEKQKKKKK